MLDDIFNYFPNRIKELIIRKANINDLEEIRIRTNRQIFLKTGQEEVKIEYIVSQQDVLEILQKICDNSIYSYQTQICNGYITLKGGHRVGITGNVVIENGKVINISYIYSLNFRIAKQILGCSRKIWKYIINEKDKTIFNTIIVSPPGRGKTTILRDLVRNISNGINEMSFKGITVGVVDERDEIAAMYKGCPQNDVGIRTDIISNVPKHIGMKMLIRSMSPKVIVADEIGTKEDVEPINYAVCSRSKRNIYSTWGKHRGYYF